MGEGANVVVVGGGVSGLATAWFLRQQAPELDVTVLEGSDRLGGKLRTVELDGLDVDTGAEAMLNRRPEAVQLARDLGLADRLRFPVTTTAGLWTRGRVRPIPGGTLMGIPGDLDAVAETGVVSDAGLARAAEDRTAPATPFDGDIAIGTYVAERLGQEVVDQLVEPLLGGVYAGHATELSFQATVPQLAARVHTEPSLLRAAEQAKAATPASDAPVFAGLDGGVGSLIPALEAACGAKIRRNAMVRELSRTPGGWRLVVGPTREPEVIDADAVVLACPARPAARLLAGVAPVAAAELDRIEYASMATIALVFEASALAEPLQGSGFLVPPTENRLIKAATYSSAKWGWLGEQAGGGRVVIRTSIGRHREEADLQRDDDELLSFAVADLNLAIGVKAMPVASYVQRWGGGLPQYAVGHRDLVERVRAEVARRPGLALAGAAYDGLGIPACIATAKAAATALVSSRPWNNDGHEREAEGT
ncbi:protoporphyrinogen oxidase [Flindersiella endophytica]